MLVGNSLNLEMALGSMDILTILILLIQEHGISLRPLQFLNVYSFQITGLSPPWLSLLLGILFFLVQL